MKIIIYILFFLLSSISVCSQSELVLENPISSDIEYAHPQCLVLKPGFSTSPGVTFRAYIGEVIAHEEQPRGKCYNEFENSNWISNCSFDLRGRLTSSGVSYFNDLGYATQTQTTDIKTGRIWASQTMYDYHNRPALQTLSAPVDSINYGYKNFAVKNDGSLFTKEDIAAITDGSTTMPSFSDQEGTLGWYYSENNDRELSQDITSYPYSRSIFSKLNPGTVLKTLGGNKVTIDGQQQWLNGYSFSMPVAQELYYVFGKDYFPERPDLSTENIGQGNVEEAFCTISDLNDTVEYRVRVTTLGGVQLYTGGEFNFILSNGLSGVYKVKSYNYLADLIEAEEACGTIRDEVAEQACYEDVYAIYDYYMNLDAIGDVQAFAGVPYYVNATKTVSRDVHGIETVVFTDADGNTVAAARSGDEESAVPPYEVVSTIGEQDYVDIHIPVGCGGPLTILGDIPNVVFTIYDLVSEETLYDRQPSTVTFNLDPGMYRIERALEEEEIGNSGQVIGVTYKPISTRSLITISNDDNVSLIDSNIMTAVKYKVNYYDYSLSYFDEANRLVKSVQPLGFDKSNLVNNIPTFNTPNHTHTTHYNYNTLGRVLESSNPDEGSAKFKYRKDGQIRFSQNSKQKAAALEEFSYTNYDALARPIESGVVVNNIVNLLPFSATDADNTQIVAGDGVLLKEQTFTVYDIPDMTELQAKLSEAGIPSAEYIQRFISGNVSKTYTRNPSTTTTWYSYDVYGRVEWLVQYVDGLGTKTIDYEYDQTTGEVTKVCYQKHVPNEMFIHKYTYNIAGQLTEVATSTDNMNFTKQVSYNYYENGSLKRTELAENLQGIDYTYNLSGQLKAINSPNIADLDVTLFKDPGNDGTNGFARDVFGLVIDYHAEDYKRRSLNLGHSLVIDGAYNQYNGNIGSIRWNTKNKITPNYFSAYAYDYNKNSWLSKALFYMQGYDTTKLLGNYGYYGSYSYDANGNLRSLYRNGVTENAPLIDYSAANSEPAPRMDDLDYNYKTGTNQLTHVSDDADGQEQGVVADDIKGQNPGNYTYNEIGQLTNNEKEQVSYIYNASGLVTEVHKNDTPLVRFYYNDKNYRVSKESFINGALIETDYYIRDASGSALAIYKNNELKEVPVYGVDRVGVYYRESGSMGYQLTDHLGNVRAVVVKTPNGQGVSINSATDYYPFGMPMPDRNDTDGNYRYAYQGQEKDSETGKEAFELRLWDSRIGRWLSPDPAKQFESPYLGMGNNPINGVDPDGAFWIPVVNKDGSISYIAEKGDSDETFAKQYGVSIEKARELIGPGKVIAGKTSVSGQDVYDLNPYDNVGFSPILKLDLNSKLANDSRVLQHYVFANDHSKSEGGQAWLSTDYFSNVLDQLQTPRRRRGNVILHTGETVKAAAEWAWYDTKGAFMKVKKYPAYFINDDTVIDSQVKGFMFGKHEDISNISVEYGILFPEGPQPQGGGGFHITVKRANEDKMLNHLKRKIPKFEYLNTKRKLIKD